MAGSSLARARSFVANIAGRVRDHNLTLVAAGTAFYAFLALVPGLIAIVSVYGLVADPRDVREQVDSIASALPLEVQHFIEFQLRSIIRAGSTEVSVTLVIAIVLALWSASGGMAALVAGIHIAHGEPPARSFFAKRAKALALTVAAIVFIGILVFVIAFVPPLIDEVTGDGGTLIVEVLRWPVLTAVMIVGLGLLFRFASRRNRRGWLGFVTTGTVVAAVGWLVLSILFSVYTAQFASYSKTYGALATIIVMLLWLFLSAFAVLVGAEVDADT
jgi:membrane protein